MRISGKRALVDWKTGTYTWVSGWVALGNRKGKREKMLCHSPRGFTERKERRKREETFLKLWDFLCHVTKVMTRGWLHEY